MYNNIIMISADETQEIEKSPVEEAEVAEEPKPVGVLYYL